MIIFLGIKGSLRINSEEPHDIVFQHSLSQSEEKSLKFIKAETEISRQDLEKYLSCSKTKCNNILKSLVQKN